MGFVVGFFALPVFEQDFFEGFAVRPCFGAGLEVLDGGDEAVFWVVDDVFDGVFRFGRGLARGEVDAGDLEAVEEEAGAAGVKLVGCEAEKNLADGGLDGGTVLGSGEVEGGAAVFSVLAIAAGLAGVEFGFGDGFAGGVVVIAEGLVAEGWAAAAVAVGEDVAALEAGLGCDGLWLNLCHGLGAPTPWLCVKSSNETS